MIKAENLCMHYGPVQALQHVNFEVKKGEIIGLLGPNGAGKSTTLKIITTYIYPTEGTVYLDNIDVRENPIPVRQRIGYLPEQLPLYMDMEVREYLQFVGYSRGLSGAKLQERLDWVTKKCGLKSVFPKLIRELSKGYKQRTALAQALIHDPEIVILDEPTSGLDPHQIIEIRNLIKELATEKTIIFSTHILQEVEAITNRIIIINRGKIVANGSMAELENAMGYQQFQLVLPSAVALGDVKSAFQKLENIQGVEAGEAKNGEIAYSIRANASKEVRPQITQLIKEKKWDFLEVKKKPFTLEEIFLQLTEPENKHKGVNQ
ncbi:MAG: ATP-binding cassette domain-containing protein [Candidatus Brocadiae bacterium]|nr:ATP-binding cassette domain-containing protein [Candidatus Brocadiia bacterium]